MNNKRACDWKWEKSRAAVIFIPFRLAAVTVRIWWYIHTKEGMKRMGFSPVAFVLIIHVARVESRVCASVTSSTIHIRQLHEQKPHQRESCTLSHKVRRSLMYIPTLGRIIYVCVHSKRHTHKAHIYVCVSLTIQRWSGYILSTFVFIYFVKSMRRNFLCLSLKFFFQQKFIKTFIDNRFTIPINYCC